MNRYLLWSIIFFLFLGTGSVQPYINPYLKDILKLPYLKFSSILAVVYFSMSFSRIIIPQILKKIGLKKGIILGSFSYFLFGFIFFLTKNYICFLFASIFWGIGAATFWTSYLTFLLKIVPEEKYGVENGIVRIFLQTGLVCGFLFLGQVLIFSGYKQIFLFASIFSFCSFFISHFLKEKKKDFTIPSFSKFIFSNKLFHFSIAMFIASIGYGIVLNFMNHYIIENFGKNFLNKTLVFFYISAGTLGYVGGKFIDKTGENKICSLFFFLSGFILVLFSIFPSLPMVVFSLLLLGGLFEIVPIASTVRIGKIILTEEKSSALAAIFFWRDIGIASGIKFLGYIRDLLSYNKGFLICGFIFLFFSLFFFLKTHSEPILNQGVVK